MSGHTCSALIKATPFNMEPISIKPAPSFSLEMLWCFAFLPTKRLRSCNIEFMLHSLHSYTGKVDTYEFFRGDRSYTSPLSSLYLQSVISVTPAYTETANKCIINTTLVISPPVQEKESKLSLTNEREKLNTDTIIVS